MTALRQRRTRATTIGLVAAVAALAAVVGLSVVGLETLADSTAGHRASEEGQPVVAQRLPFTSTALLGVADEDGRLTTLVVGVLESDGTGGSIVQIPVAADPSSGNADTLAPIDAVFTVAGPIAFREAVERLTGLSFDVIEITDQQRFSQLLTPLGDMDVDLPGAVRDASTAETWEPGPQLMTAPGAARLVTATDPEVPGWGYEPARAAVWEAVAERVGAGIGSASPVAVDTDLPVPGSTDEFLDRLFAGPTEVRVLQFRPVDATEAAERVGPPYREAFGADVADTVVLLDRAEMLMVFGGIAPARLGAPLDAPIFRVVNGFDDGDTEVVGKLPADLTRTVVNVLMFTKVNVVSVVDRADTDVPAVTQVRVSDPDLLDGLAGVYEPHFGELEVVRTDAAIDGIDAEIVLGRSFIERLAADPGGGMAGSSDTDTGRAVDTNGADADDDDD
ncbi:MAG TPA: hypothetical protein VK917_06385 [Ilumatobacter sp.]|nr:hypothetical protein [Ilumatobacter sp.]